MRVKDVMTPSPVTCTPEMTLAAAAGLMWDADCGFLPVVESGHVVGVITDRDITVALATRYARAADMHVGDVACRSVWTCGADDDSHTALAVMKEYRVRRLPVVGANGALLGVISMNDLIMAAAPDTAIRSDEVMETLKAICAHHLPVPRARTV